MRPVTIPNSYADFASGMSSNFNEQASTIRMAETNRPFYLAGENGFTSQLYTDEESKGFRGETSITPPANCANWEEKTRVFGRILAHSKIDFSSTFNATEDNHHPIIIATDSFIGLGNAVFSRAKDFRHNHIIKQQSINFFQLFDQIVLGFADVQANKDFAQNRLLDRVEPAKSEKATGIKAANAALAKYAEVFNKLKQKMSAKLELALRLYIHQAVHKIMTPKQPKFDILDK